MITQNDEDVEPDDILLAAAEQEEENDEDIELETDQGVASHYGDAIKLYLKEIQKGTLLTADDERSLAILIGQGDEAARARMI